MIALVLLIFALIGIVIGTGMVVLNNTLLPGVCILVISGLTGMLSLFLLTFRYVLPQEWLC